MNEWDGSVDGFLPESVPLDEMVLDEIKALHPRRSIAFKRVPQNVRDISVALARHRPKVIDLTKISQDDISFLAASGMSKHFVIEAAEDDQKREAELRIAFDASFSLEVRRPSEVEQQLFKKSFVREASYILTVLKCGGMLIRDPFSGEILRSSHSFLVDDYHIAFRFSSVEVFYLMVGQMYGQRITLIVPRLRLVIVFPLKQANPALLAWVVDCSERLLALLISGGADVRRVLTKPSVVGGVQLGFRQNLGHYVWQELQGIADIIEACGVNAIRHLVRGPYTPLDPREVFPELKEIPFTEIRNPKDPFEMTFGLDVQHVRPVGLRISSNLRDRIQKVVDGRVSEITRGIIHAAEISKFLVWINLRSHNKAWKQQVSGTAKILNRLSTVIPSLAVVFDGFNDTAPICAEIASELSSEIEVINTIGCPIEESLAWAKAIHVYSSVVGSGLVINSWLSRKPGVAHANAAHLRQAGFWNLVAEDMISPYFLSRELIEDDGTMYGAYDFDPNVLYEALLSVVRQYYPGRLKPKNGLTDEA